MTRSDLFSFEQWRSFYSLAGTGAVSLTALVFVGLSLNLKDIANSATHRYRAIATLTGLAAIFLRSCLVLMGDQSQVAVGVELLVVAAGAAFLYVYGFARTSREDGQISRSRLVIGASLYAAEIGGAIAVISGSAFGLYVAATAMTLNACYMISGAWLLIVGIYQEKTGK